MGRRRRGNPVWAGKNQSAEALLARLGATRFGKPEEVGSLVAFMISGQADYLNGAAIELDSGVRRDI